MIFFAVAAPTPGRLSRSAWLALLMSIFSALAASAGVGDIARPQARIAATTRAPLVAVRIVDLPARGTLRGLILSTFRLIPRSTSFQPHEAAAPTG